MLSPRTIIGLSSRARVVSIINSRDNQWLSVALMCVHQAAKAQTATAAISASRVPFIRLPRFCLQRVCPLAG
jgi:hypothetical protein